MHDDIYGEQSITITNNFNESVSIYIYSINGSDSKSLGSVSANSTKTFNLNWRNDCHYDFTALKGSYEYSIYNKNVCGGANWSIP